MAVPGDFPSAMSLNMKAAVDKFVFPRNYIPPQHFYLRNIQQLPVSLHHWPRLTPRLSQTLGLA